VWNAGIFAWRVEALHDAVGRFLPRTAAALDALAAGTSLGDAWAATDATSIDVGVLERATNVVVVLVDCGWSDVGAWSALDEALPPTEGGTVHAEAVVAQDAARNIVHAAGKLVALLGVDDLVVVDTPDVLLVARRDRAQDVRDLVDAVERRGLRRHT
jgi:mannose-1-phosphate guanylyltransferase